MWTKQVIKATETAIRFRICQANQVLNFQEVCQLWMTSTAFRTFYIENNLAKHCWKWRHLVAY